MRGDRLIWSVVVMVAITNLLDAAYSAVLLPVWIHDHGYDTTQLGLIGMTFALAATGGSLIATALAGRLRGGWSSWAASCSVAHRGSSFWPSTHRCGPSW